MMIVSEKILFELERILEPLAFAQNAENVEYLLEELGWKFNVEVLEDNPIVNLSVLTSELSREIANFADDEDVIDDTLNELISSVQNIHNFVKNLSSIDFNKLINVPLNFSSASSFDNFLADFLFQLPLRLIQYLLIRYLDMYVPKLAVSLRLIGVIKKNPREILAEDVSEFVQTFKRESFDIEKLLGFISSPKNVFNRVYSWGGDDFNDEGFINNIHSVVSAFNFLGGIFDVGYIEDDDFDEEEVNSELSSELRVPIFSFGSFPENYKELGILLKPIPSAEFGAVKLPSGLELELYCTNLSNKYFNQSFPLDEDFQVNLKGDIKKLLPLQAVFTPDSDISIQTILPDEGEVVEEDINIVNSFSIEATENEQNGPVILFGDKDSTHLQMSGFKILAALQGDLTSPEVKLELGCRLLEFIFNPGGSDNFIGKILNKKIKIESEFLAGISTSKGLYFSGSAGLDATIPLHLKLLSVLFESIHIALSINANNDIDFKTAMNFSGELGPIKFSVKELGIIAGIKKLSDFNNLLDNIKPVSILPPAGAGLSIDAGAIVGGGFLDFDKDNKRYAGMLQLALGDIGLVATGLIATRMPDGSNNFSMLVSLGVTFNPSIPLAFGFTLSGVGGLIGINRTMDTEVLRAGLRNHSNHTVDSIMFPENPIANATKIISDLRTVLPPEDGRYVIGPMLKIGWGSPNMITADVGLFIELPEPVRMVVLGQLFAALPNKDNALVEINLDLLGEIDFSKKSLAIDATIYDSKIVRYSLTGDAALRLMWGDNPQFAMSLGGFHPKFSPPPAFPVLRRLMLDLSSGSDLVLTCKAYKALTANSLQFGANIDLYAQAGDVKVNGNLAFDTLFYFDPFLFSTAISGLITAKYKGRKLSAIRLALDLFGPTPWKAKGKASFEILWWDISFSIDEKWGAEDITLEDKINPYDKLRDALERSESWGTALPHESSMVESLRSFDNDDKSNIIMHPSGNIEVKQNVLPFGEKIEKFGNALVDEESIFSIDSIVIDNILNSDSTEDDSLEPVEIDTIKEYECFARGQFQKLTDDEKLSFPSFEKMGCGVSAGLDQIKFGDEATRKTCPFEYESILIKDDRTSTFKRLGRSLFWKAAKRQVKGNARTRMGLRKTGNRKFVILGEKPKVGVVEEKYTIVNKQDMSIHRSVGDEKLTKMKADQMLKDYINLNPAEKNNLQVIPLFELGRVA